jgi:pimeloyl-ACP methyl ester carboxylesterase
MQRIWLSTSLVVLAFLVGCQDRSGIVTDPDLEESDIPAPALSIVDGAHGGTDGFYFMPPLVTSPPPTSETFENSLLENLEVQVCELAEEECVEGGFERTFTSSTGSFFDKLKLVPDYQYIVYWATGPDDLDPDKTYRVKVLLYGVPLGHADVDVVSSMVEFGSVNRDEYAPLYKDMTLPIGFRVEEGLAPPQPSIFEVDPELLTLESTEEELDQGVFRFQKAPGTSVPEVGEVIVGIEKGGFLRRVTDVQDGGGEVRLSTSFISMADAVGQGSFSTEVSFEGIGLSSRMTTSEMTGLERLRAGAPDVQFLAEGVTLGPERIDLEGLDLCAALFGDQCPEGVEIFLPEGSIDFDPDLRLEADFGLFSLKRFEAVAEGTLTYDVTMGVRASRSFEAEGEAEIAKIAKPFLMVLAGPVPIPVAGEVILSITAGYESSASVEAEFAAGFTSTHMASAGARYESGSWSPVIGFEHESELIPPRFEGDAQASGRVYMRPELSIILYRVAGPYIGVEPDIEAALATGFGATVPECSFDLEGDLDAVLGIDVTILDDDVAGLDYRFDGPIWIEKRLSSENFYQLRGPLHTGSESSTHVVFVHGVDLFRPICLSWLTYPPEEAAERFFSGFEGHFPEATRWVYTYPTFADLSLAGERFATQLQDRFSPSDDVIIVGYSMGGLVGRGALGQLPDGEGWIDGMVTVATPHLGSPLATLGDEVPFLVTEGIQDMSETSSYLEDLPIPQIPTVTFSGRAEETTRPWIEILKDLIPSPNDGVVPEPSAKFEFNRFGERNTHVTVYQPEESWYPYDHIDLGAGRASEGEVDPLFEEVAKVAKELVGSQPPTGLIAHYPFDGDAEDMSGNALDGTVFGASPLSDRFGAPGGALGFDGIDDYVKTQAHNAVDQAEEGSLSLWFKSSNVPGTSGFPEGKLFTYSTDQSIQSIFGVAIQDDGRIKVTPKYDSPSTPTQFSEIEVLDGKWHHLVVVADGSSLRKVYIDGREVGTTFDPKGTSADGSEWFADISGVDSYDHFFSFGRQLRGGIAQSEFQGAIDEIRIYDYPLTPQEVQDLCDVDGICDGGTIPGSVEFCSLPDLHFDGNNISEPFVVAASRGVDGPVNERLEAYPIDGLIRLTGNTRIPAGTDEIAVSYREKMNPSYWGNYSILYFHDEAGERFYRFYLISADKPGYGRGNLLTRVNTPEHSDQFDPIDSAVVPFNYEEMSVEVRLSETDTHVIVRNADTGAIIMSEVLAAPLDFSRVRAISLQKVATTDSSGWTDDYGFSCGYGPSGGGLTAHYPLDGNAVDVSGNGHDGTLYGAVPAPDRFGTPGMALNFDGENDHILVDPVPSLDVTQPTISAWVKLDRTAPSRLYKIVNRQEEKASVTSFGLLARYGLPSFNSSSGTSVGRVDGPDLLEAGKWYFLAGTNDGTTLRMYVNGELVLTWIDPRNVQRASPGGRIPLSTRRVRRRDCRLRRRRQSPSGSGGGG